MAKTYSRVGYLTGRELTFNSGAPQHAVRVDEIHELHTQTTTQTRTV
jgi:hypothetical protein